MNHSFLLLLILFFLPLTIKEVLCINKFTRNDFPPDFVFGAGTSSYQYEGAVAEDGRTPSIWDTFAHEGRIPDKSTGDIASDGYHKYKEDAKLMSDTGLEAYRFSISWSRILPNGRGAVNPIGLKYYKSVINEIFERGIKIHVSLHHLDLPQILHDEYGGWLSPKIVEFGDKVSHWTTIVEPNIYGMAGYDTGTFAPARCSLPFSLKNCTGGNSTTEPYIAVHNMLISHAEVVKLYRTKYQGNQNGKIGLNIYSFWGYPFSNSFADIEAVQRVFKFQFGWNGVNVKGYFIWSFIDVFEYLSGYQSSCGLYHVDFDDELRPRTPKLSAHWYYNFLKNNREAFSMERTDLQDMLHFSQ